MRSSHDYSPHELDGTSPWHTIQGISSFNKTMNNKWPSTTVLAGVSESQELYSSLIICTWLGWRNKTVYSSILNPKAQTTLIKRSSKTGESRWATLMSPDACVVPPVDGGEVVWAWRVNESRPRGVGRWECWRMAHWEADPTYRCLLNS